MPTYEYACRDCGEHLEVVQSFTDAPLSVCGACGGALRKVFSAAGIIFKGSGYYVTDTREKAAKPSSGSGGAKGGSKDGSEGKGAPKDGGASSSSKSSEGSSKGDTSTSSGEAKSA